MRVALAGLGVGTAFSLLLLASPARADDQRPSEDQMFGAPAGQKPADQKPAAAPAKPAENVPGETTPPGQLTPAPPPKDGLPPVGTPAAAEAATKAASTPTGEARDDRLLGDPNAGPQLSTQVAPENPLTIGGQLYLRAQSTAYLHTSADRWSLASPNLLDAYFDARPNDRVRAFILGRVSYDPTVAPGATTAAGALGVSTNGGAATGTNSATGFTTFSQSRGPTAILDQMWIAFDINHDVFVTAGKQHVRWGTGRFWTPTDYLHPVKRNPLDVFDARPGTTMLKLNIPWEARAWNFYAFGVFEDPNAATNTLGQVAGAGRAELVEGAAELGLDFLVKRDQKPLLGADISIGVDDFDFYGDAGLRFGSDVLVVSRVENPPTGTMNCPDGSPNPILLAQQYTASPSSGPKPQIVGGMTWARKYNDNDVLTLGGEYFYNSLGYNDASIYPGLLFNNQCVPLFNFFYTGRHYAALFLSLPAPYSWNYTTFTLSTIGNLSDHSYVTRLDYSLTLLTHLTFEAFAAVHYGNAPGEFRFSVPALETPAGIVAGTPSPIPLIDLGVALRLRI